MSATKKITKKEYYNAVLALVDAAEATGVTLPEGMTYEGMTTFVNHEIELLDGKAAAAAARAAAKREQGDALREQVYATLSDDEFMTIDQIVAAIGDPEVTRNMVTSRLTQLKDRVIKDSISVGAEDGGKARKVSAYKRA